MSGLTISMSTAVVEPESAETEVSGGPAEARSSIMRLLRTLLLEPRPAGDFSWPEAVTLAAFCLVLFATILRHESWFDEAQAWLIARDSGLADMFLHRLHYEGAPGLWHLLLWCEARCGLNFTGMHIVAGILASVGIAAWLRFNPLPRLLSLLMPFTYFFMFQYAVVARSYTLAPLFVFVLMRLYSNRKSSPVLFAVAAGLFANCSLHMAAFAVGLALLYAQDRLFSPGSRSLADAIRRSRRLVAPALVLGGFLVAAALTAVPTADGASTTANPIVSSLRALGSHASKAEYLQTAPTAIPTTDTGNEVSTPPPQGRLGTMLWYLIHGSGETSPKVRAKSALIKHAVVLLTAITGPISTSNLLAFAFLGVLLWNIAQTRLWLALAPYVLVQLCNLTIAGEAHHIGLTWVALVAALWAIALYPSRELSPGQTATIPTAVALLFASTLVVMVLQAGWSVHAVGTDLMGPYSGDAAMAEYLRRQPRSERIANFDQAEDAPNAYLDYRPYFNNDTSYWPFSRTGNPDLHFAEVMATHPDKVVVTISLVDTPVMNQWVTLLPKGMTLTDPAHLAYLRSHGYHETERFCGARVFRDAAESLDCNAVYSRDATARP